MTLQFTVRRGKSKTTVVKLDVTHTAVLSLYGFSALLNPLKPF